MRFEMNSNYFNVSVSAGNAQAAKQQTEAKRRVLASTIAGAWYPGDAKTLKSTIEGYLSQADVAANGSMVGNASNIFIVPHAGYAYSGPCAAHAYRHFRNRGFNRVILLAPSHRVFLKNEYVIPDSDAVSTPLGEIPIDAALRKAIFGLPGVQKSDRVHINEHSTQIQYPFLQTVLTEPFTILPVIIGMLTADTVALLSAFLRKQLNDPKTVLVVSSDFTHYGTDFGYTPFAQDRLQNTKKVDLMAYHYIQMNDAEAFHSYISENNCTICGAEAIRVALAINPDSHEATLFKYCTSADANPADDARFVCYLACGIEAGFIPADENTLSQAEKQQLLKFARRSIQTKLTTNRAPAPNAYKNETTSATRLTTGAFVTLNTADGNLRGCIGEIEPYRPLYEAVTARACDAAFRDPRFRPLSAEEFNNIVIEISALTVPHPIDDWRKIELGKHGMTVSKYGRSAVFLPQVAPEQGWTLEETLSNLCLKAGLRPNDFREGATFTVFEAIVFNEKDMK